MAPPDLYKGSQNRKDKDVHCNVSTPRRAFPSTPNRMSFTPLRFPKPASLIKGKSVGVRGDYTLSQLKNILNFVKSDERPYGSGLSMDSNNFRLLEMELRRQEIAAMESLRLMRRDFWEQKVLTRQQGRFEPRRPPVEDDSEYLRDEKDKAMRKKPVLTSKSSLHYFQSPPNRLPSSWGERPGTPLQYIYGNIVNNLPTSSYKDRRKGVLQAVENGFMYRHIKNAMKTSVYSRKVQLEDFKKHQAYLKCRRPVANVEKLNKPKKGKPKTVQSYESTSLGGKNMSPIQRKPSFPSMAADKRRPGTALTRKGKSRNSSAIGQRDANYSKELSSLGKGQSGSLKEPVDKKVNSKKTKEVRDQARVSASRNESNESKFASLSSSNEDYRLDKVRKLIDKRDGHINKSSKTRDESSEISSCESSSLPEEIKNYMNDLTNKRAGLESSELFGSSAIALVKEEFEKSTLRNRIGRHLRKSKYFQGNTNNHQVESVKKYGIQEKRKAMRKRSSSRFRDYSPDQVPQATNSSVESPGDSVQDTQLVKYCNGKASSHEYSSPKKVLSNNSNSGENSQEHLSHDTTLALGKYSDSFVNNSSSKHESSAEEIGKISARNRDYIPQEILIPSSPGHFSPEPSGSICREPEFQQKVETLVSLKPKYEKKTVAMTAAQVDRDRRVPISVDKSSVRADRQNSSVKSLTNVHDYSRGRDTPYPRDSCVKQYIRENAEIYNSNYPTKKEPSRNPLPESFRRAEEKHKQRFVPSPVNDRKRLSQIAISQGREIVRRSVNARQKNLSTIEKSTSQIGFSQGQEIVRRYVNTRQKNLSTIEKSTSQIGFSQCSESGKLRSRNTVKPSNEPVISYSRNQAPPFICPKMVVPTQDRGEGNTRISQSNINKTIKR